jgi:hypothetical protein
LSPFFGLNLAKKQPKEVRSLKFKILPKVSGFTDAQGVTHSPGEIVDLPEMYKGENWLELVDKEPKPVLPPAKVEAAEPAAPEVPLEPKKKKAK